VALVAVEIGEEQRGAARLVEVHGAAGAELRAPAEPLAVLAPFDGEGAGALEIDARVLVEAGRAAAVAVGEVAVVAQLDAGLVPVAAAGAAPDLAAAAAAAAATSGVQRLARAL